MNRTLRLIGTVTAHRGAQVPAFKLGTPLIERVSTDLEGSLPP